MDKTKALTATIAALSGFGLGSPALGESVHAQIFDTHNSTEQMTVREMNKDDYIQYLDSLIDAAVDPNIDSPLNDYDMSYSYLLTALEGGKISITDAQEAKNLVRNYIEGDISVSERFPLEKKQARFFGDIERLTGVRYISEEVGNNSQPKIDNQINNPQRPTGPIF